MNVREQFKKAFPQFNLPNFAPIIILTREGYSEVDERFLIWVKQYYPSYLIGFWRVKYKFKTTNNDNTIS